MATEHTSRLYNAVLETRDDLPGVGVLDIMHGVCLVARVDGNAIQVLYDTRVDIAANLARVFPSAAAAWEFLRLQERKPDPDLDICRYCGAAVTPAESHILRQTGYCGACADSMFCW